jgi:hypothetical protein
MTPRIVWTGLLWLSAAAVAAAQPPVFVAQGGKPQPSGVEELTPPTKATPAVTVPALVPEPLPACCPPQLPCTPCCPGYCWANAEFLLWWIKDDDIPVLLTTGPAEVPVAVLGSPTTTVLLSGDDLEHEEFIGARFSAGYHFGHCCPLGIEGTFFFLDERTRGGSFNSDQFPVLARPFFSLNRGTEFSEVLAFPGVATGGLGASLSSRLLGAEINLTGDLCPCCPPCPPCPAPACGGCSDPLGCADCGRCGGRFGCLKALCACAPPPCVRYTKVLVGFRYVDLDEELAITETTSIAADAEDFGDLAGANVLIRDRFATRNRFYGPQIGAATNFSWGRVTLDLRGKVAFGVNQEDVNILGSQAVTLATGERRFFQGGLLALPSNIGRSNQNEFAVVPELGVNLGYQVCNFFAVYVGYNLLYISDVVRPGGQIDRVLDETLIPNFVTAQAPAAVARPVAPFKQTDFWAQGVNFGFEVRW